MDAFSLPAEQAEDLGRLLARTTDQWGTRADVSTVPRAFVLATIAVPIVMYCLMPRLHRLRAHLLVRMAG